MSSGLQQRTPAAGYSSQGTAIEAARATADVMVAMEAAKRWPRIMDEDDPNNVFARMTATCRRERVAKTAFWTYPRGKDKWGRPNILTGSSVYLMRTIAQVWGNCTFGARELDRNPRARWSEMLAWAWDLESNMRIEETFLVPWVIDTEDGPKELRSTREIRDQLSNVAQRKVRVQIANMLPDEYVEDAEAAARAVLEGKDKKIEVVRKEIVDLLKPLQVPIEYVLARVGRLPEGEPTRKDLTAAWNETTRGDLALLRILAAQVEREEATIREMFPAPPRPAPVVISTPAAAAEPGPDTQPQEEEQAGAQPQDAEPADATAEPAAEGAAAEPATDGAEPDPARPEPARRPGRPGRGRPSNQQQRGKFLGLMRDAGFPTMPAALLTVQLLAEGVDAPRGSLSEHTTVELSQVINTLEGWVAAGELAQRVDALLPGEGDPAWGPVEAAREAYLVANDRSTARDGEDGGTDTP